MNGTTPPVLVRTGRSGVLPVVALACLSGILLALSLPPFGIWLLGPLGAALLYRSLEARRPRARVLIGLLSGVCQFGIGLFFISQFTGFGYPIAVLIEALFVALGCLAVRPGSGSVISFTAALSLAEWARDTWPFGGLPIGSVALGQASSPIGQAARLSGPILVCALVYLLGASLCLGLRGLRRLLALVSSEKEASRRAGRSLLGATVGIVMVLGLLGLSEDLGRGGASSARIDAVAIQGGGPRGLSQIEVPTVDALARTVDESAPLPKGTELVLWPEDTVPLAAALGGEPAGEILAHMARSLRVTIVAGATLPVAHQHFLNEVLEVGPSGKVVGHVEKVHPVPFGEYVPLRPILRHLVDLADLPLDAIPGKAPEVLASPYGRLGVLISYESFFPGLGRAAVRAGGEAFLLPTNTASYATSQIPAQELAASRLVAIATGREILQAATTGYSAFIDPGGGVHDLSRLGAAQLLHGALALRRGETLYDELGELPVLVLAGLSLAGAWLAAWRRKGLRANPS